MHKHFNIFLVLILLVPNGLYAQDSGSEDSAEAVEQIPEPAIIPQANTTDQTSPVIENNEGANSATSASSASEQADAIADAQRQMNSTSNEAAAMPQASLPNTLLDTLELRDMDINDVLKLLASKSGLNIIAGKTIAGRVTIFLQNVDVRDALTIILKANDLAFIDDKGIIQVVTSAEYEQMYGHKFGVKTDSKVIALQSMKAADAVALLNQVKSASGKVIADEQTNSIIIEEVPDRLKVLLDYITTVDVPTELKVYKVQYVPAEALTTKIQEMVSPKIGSAKFDLASNKIFVKDTVKKIADIDAFIKQIDIPRETKVFNINYAKAEEITKTITTMLTKDIGNAQFDARTNNVMVTDIAPKIEEIGKIIRAMDRQQKQVLIEARIVQIDLSDKYKMGIDWQSIIPNNDHQLLKLSNNLSQAKDVNIAAGAESVATIGTLGRETYNAVLNMISSLGNTKTLSNPRIAVVNNQEARIKVGSSVPYVTSTTTQGTGTAVTAEDVKMIEVGIILVVTPMIHDDGYVTMKIKPEVSSADTPVITKDGNSIPIKQTSEVDTTIRVKDGVTIMIGGLIKDVALNTKSKIPVLGDIPLLGKAFRSEVRTAEKTEIIIFLTPKIISGDVQADESNYPQVPKKVNNTYYNPLPKEDSIDPVK